MINLALNIIIQMSERMTIRVFVLIVLAYSKPCSKLANDAYNVNFRENEIFEKPLADFFNDDATSSFKIKPLSTDIQIVEYVEEIKKIVKPQFESIHAAKAKTYFLERRWKNQFALLEKKGLIWNLHMTDSSPTNRLPEFVTTIKITDDADTICFDLVFSGDDIVIDCQNATNDLLYKYGKGAVDVTLIDTHPKFQNGATKRILVGDQTKIARGSLYDALENQESIIQVRRKDQYIQNIDSDLLAQLLSNPLYKLHLVSFSLLDELIPYVAIYDKAGNFIILKYLINKWIMSYQEELNIANAIDFDFKRDPQIQTTRILQPLVYLIVQTDKTTVIQNYDNQKITFELPLKVDTISNTWISLDNYMLYASNNLYQLIIEESSLILKSQQTIDALWMIPDLTSNQFTTLTSLYTTNKQKYLRITGQEAGVYNLIQNNPSCTVLLNLVKLDDQKLAIREPGFESIKNVLYGGNESQEYFDNFDGPAIQYTQTVTDKRVQLNFIKNSQITYTQQPQQTKPIFTQILAIANQPKKFYQVQQLQDYQVLINLCILNAESKQLNCKFRSKYLETVKLTSQNAHFFIQNDIVRGIILRSYNEIIDFIDSDNDQYFQTQAIEKIKQISVSLNYLYVLTEQQIRIYHISQNRFFYLFSTNFGINNIQNILVNSKHDKILIQSENSFQVGQVYGTSYILGYSFEYNSIYRTSAVLLQNNFVIISVDPQNNIQMKQFDFQDIYNVKYQFEIPSYDYKLIGSIKVATDSIQNYYLVAQNTAKKPSFYTLNFRTTGVSSSALYQVIMTSEEPTISASDQILYQGSLDRYFMVPQQMIVETTFNIPQTEYQRTYQVEIYAQTNDQKIKIIQDLNVIKISDDSFLNKNNITIDALDNLEKQEVKIVVDDDNHKDPSTTQLIQYIQTRTTEESFITVWKSLSIVLTSGICYGLWKLYQSRKQAQSDQLLS